MRILISVTLCLLGLGTWVSAVPKPHTVVLGKWTTVKLLAGENENEPVDIKIRPLLVDGKLKEVTTGASHDVTDRVFVVQRAYRLNDLLPGENSASRWRWERGAWLLVDRSTGKVQILSLPLFAAHYSQVSWFRDFAAYCGLSGDRLKAFTMVVQLGSRKPLFKQLLGKSASPADQPCPSPVWSRTPARVTFDVPGEPKFTFTVRSQAVDLLTGDADEGGD